jgi:uncharacterized membrane protein
MRILREERVESRPSFWFLILSHHSFARLSHTFRISVGTRNAYVCARCTGIAIGIVVGLAYIDVLADWFFQYPVLIFVFTMPAAIDWLFQVFKWRESTNSRRLMTGALIGQAYLVGLIALIRDWLPLLTYYVIAFATYGAVLYSIFRKTGAMNDYLATSWPTSQT